MLRKDGSSDSLKGSKESKKWSKGVRLGAHFISPPMF